MKDGVWRKAADRKVGHMRDGGGTRSCLSTEFRLCEIEDEAHFKVLWGLDELYWLGL